MTNLQNQKFGTLVILQTLESPKSVWKHWKSWPLGEGLHQEGLRYEQHCLNTQAQFSSVHRQLSLRPRGTHHNMVPSGGWTRAEPTGPGVRPRAVRVWHGNKDNLERPVPLALETLPRSRTVPKWGQCGVL